MTNAPQPSETKNYVRFDPLQRIQHIVFLVSFTLLGFTGLPQKFPLSPISIGLFDLLGGVETARLIHHTSAIVMMIVSVIHVLDVTYRVLVLRTPISMIPWINDLQHVIHDVQYYLGFKKHKAYYGRYSYAEKMEYLALIWGTVVMGLTGFMMWNPISTLRILPGEAVPAAKAAHGGEALLAVLAIIIWHFYHVHIKHLNKSMFTGKLSREEMEHEHPAELATIDSGAHADAIPPAVLQKRRMVYAPIAIAILAIFSYGFYFFVGYETTAVLPVVTQTVEIFVPRTATPTRTHTPLPTSTATQTPIPTNTVAVSASEDATSEATTDATSTSAPAAPASSTTWDGQIYPNIVSQKCLMCHGPAASGGLILSTYADAMKGGTTGPIFVAGDATNSLLITKFESGKHPYAQLTPEELTLISDWINASMPEK